MAARVCGARSTGSLSRRRRVQGGPRRRRGTQGESRRCRELRRPAWEEDEDLFDADLEGDYGLKDVGYSSPSPSQTRSSRGKKSSADEAASYGVEEDFEGEVDPAAKVKRTNGIWVRSRKEFEQVKEQVEQWKKTPSGIRWLRVKDKLYPQDSIPPVGDATISYARLLELLAQRRVKRLTVLNEGRDAIVEVPVPNCANDFSYQEAIEGVSEREPEMIYCGEAPEWSMEKDRFYCPLPGDLWRDNKFLELCKENLPKRGEDGKIAKENRLVTDQCYLEIVVHQPDYYWMTTGRVFSISKPFGTLLVVQFLLTLWYRNKKRKEEEMRKQKDYFRKSLAKAFNVKGKGGEVKSTGVDFADVAGVDKIKSAISQVMEMLVSDISFTKAGVKPPRGMLFYGPPGTGKTMLAKALAGEFNVPFFACNGAEFVEMYEGIAAERVKHIFNTARASSPAIIFIDEIDALGKKRSAFSDDPGVQEREQGLLQLLIEMDGFRPTERVLVIGATNMATDLDEALLRPGRFDRKFFIDTPSKQNRFKILEVHARNRPLIPRKGHPEHDDEDALLLETARITPGFSGAGLENLLNEATILAVRRGKKIADMDMILELLEQQSIGLKQGGLEPSMPKERLAMFHAARAIASALTPGGSTLKFVSLALRKKEVTGLVFEDLDETDEELGWWRLLYLERGVPEGGKTAEGGDDFSLFSNSLLPLCVGKAVEEGWFGEGSCSQLSSTDLAKACELGASLLNTQMGGETAWSKGAGEREKQLAALISKASEEAADFIKVHRNSIRVLASALLEDRDVPLSEIHTILEESEERAFPGHLTFHHTSAKAGMLSF
ncbi:ATP-dependent zinc metalloprotease FtsH [Chloropicon primus]|uniref:ATP-dependent zinc metalloprotease FtsH n=3 Tax=Chloropicon primus TaxID=1764295 RepID=A0A5B8MLR6_9CHLO|nr:ATP-dependent zinc metalloprotease FtsH [Chloropicon primus]UPR00602.1 ATP-dependent zinc metalloprotease FtsH [Chloropicon primus]|eukprot:QDZ21387.1 ATP-dependent zinc metalloprotease FtsH [Chloropicon primus]